MCHILRVTSGIVGGENQTIALLVVGVEAGGAVRCTLARYGCEVEYMVSLDKIYDALVYHRAYLEVCKVCNFHRVGNLAVQLRYNSLLNPLEALAILLGDRLGRFLRNIQWVDCGVALP